MKSICITLPLSILLTFLLSVLSLSLEQGCRNDLIKKSCKHPPLTVRTHPLGDSVQFDELWLISGISNSVHYPPLIHSHVLLGSSCHADTVLPNDHSNPQPLSSNNVMTFSKSWFHVYSQMKANCSQCTQCAAADYLLVFDPVCHC